MVHNARRLLVAALCYLGPDSKNELYFSISVEWNDRIRTVHQQCNWQWNCNFHLHNWSCRSLLFHSATFLMLKSFFIILYCNFSRNLTAFHMFRESFLHTSFTESTIEVFTLADRLQVRLIMLKLMTLSKILENVSFNVIYIWAYSLPEYYSLNHFVEPILLLLLPPRYIKSDLLWSQNSILDIYNTIGYSC